MPLEEHADITFKKGGIKLQVVAREGTYIRQSGSARDISLAHFALWVKDQMNGNDLPVEFGGGDVVITYLNALIVVRPGGTEYSFEAAVDLAFDGVPASLTGLAVSYRSDDKSFTLAATVRVRMSGEKGAPAEELTGRLHKDTQGWTLEAGWHAEEAGGVSVAELASAFGIG
ncbi:hypothetical protein FAF44_37570 [Nonomuraea sp. MG754425]|uniref:hypothetical protein n=1 Tax=Nonomuraea sp. MG754425 TaxID=2570319 RepID=UPI001F2AB9CA|nr:hypothetical protein [Nonomuraea sp. MG754425]MCF6474053.1 hypothetical protein [Nonomuraea sp. MG754425]